MEPLVSSKLKIKQRWLLQPFLDTWTTLLVEQVNERWWYSFTFTHPQPNPKIERFQMSAKIKEMGERERERNLIMPFCRTLLLYSFYEGTK